MSEMFFVACNFGFVDHTFCLVQCWCPRIVFGNLGRCLWTNAEVMCGHVLKNPLSIALHHVLMCGKKQHLCRYFMTSLILVRWYTLLMFCCSPLVELFLMLQRFNSYMLFCMFCLAQKMCCLFFEMVAAVSVKMTIHLSLHN